MLLWSHYIFDMKPFLRPESNHDKHLKTQPKGDNDQQRKRLNLSIWKKNNIANKKTEAGDHTLSSDKDLRDIDFDGVANTKTGIKDHPLPSEKDLRDIKIDGADYNLFLRKVSKLYM